MFYFKTEEDLILTDYGEITRFKQSWPLWRLVLTGLNILALVLSAIMSWHYLAGGSMAGCGGGSPCEQVLNSRWSDIAGIFPVSGLAIGVYLAMLISGLYIGPAADESIRRLAWKVMLILAGAIAGSAVWFTILQKWVIRAFCPYCMTAHMTGLLLASLIIWRALFKPGGNLSGRIIKPLPAAGLALSGMALAGILAVFQAGFNPLAVNSDSSSQENLPAIDYHNAPIVGSPEAPYIVTLLFDYQCPHCQKIHFMLDEVVHRYNNKLAFVICPAPLNSRCNPYIPRDVDAYINSCDLAGIGLAVWLADRKAFPVFDNWMFTYESGNFWLPRSPEAAREKAIDLVGREKFEASSTNPWIGQYMKTSTQIYGYTIQSGMGGIPKMIFGSRWVIPEPFNADDLIRILQENLGVPTP